MITSTRRTALTVLGATLAAAAAAPATFAASARASSGEIGRFDFTGWSGPALPVWTFRPEGVENPPLAIILHGQRRNGADYRDQWIAPARAHGFAVIAPEFGRRDFPTSAEYNLGWRVNEDGSDRASDLWSFAAIEPLFDAARAVLGLTCDSYGLYGHSAGAQFVHRYTAFAPAPRLHAAVAANAGWYTLPDLEAAWPFGFGGAGLTETELRRWLARPLTILLGSADTEQTSSLNQSPEAMAQGPHRLARGRYFMEAGLTAAERLGAPIAWRLGYVAGVGHENTDMAPHAARDLLRAGGLARG